MPEPRPADIVRFNTRVNRLVGQAANVEASTARQLLEEMSKVQHELRLMVAESAGTTHAAQLDAMSSRVRALADVVDDVVRSAHLESARIGAALIDEPLAVLGVTDLAPVNDLELARWAESRASRSRVLLRRYMDDLQQKAAAQLLQALNADDPLVVLRNIGTRLKGSVVFGKAAGDSLTLVYTELGTTRHAVMNRRGRDVNQSTGIEVHKRWVHAGNHTNARRHHEDAEQRYRPGGAVGPIPMTELFKVGKYSTPYPKGPGLPGLDRLGCRCQLATCPPPDIPDLPGVAA
jgi:hypothetical protein